MSAIVSMQAVLVAIGAILALLAIQTLRDASNPKRWTSGLFWGLIAADFLLDRPMSVWLGEAMCHRLVGLSVIAMAVIAGIRGVGAGQSALASPAFLRTEVIRLGNRLFLAALIIPTVTVAGVVRLKHVRIGGLPLLDPANLTITALGLAVVTASLLAWPLVGGRPAEGVREGRRLLESIGWAAMLPQMLALLGGVFVSAGTGQAIRRVVLDIAPHDNRFAMVAIYGLGMALFTMVTGNAFAAFPVMTAGIALPILVHDFGADPAPLVAIGMYCGYCGTLMTPLAANFNIVPAILLDLKDRHGVIRAQIPTALSLLGINILLIYFLAFR